MASDVNSKSQELATKLKAIADDLRGNMDSSRFKDYILGIIFYRYLSERTEKYMNELLVDDNMTYEEALANEAMVATVEAWSIEHLGYIIYPGDFFRNFVDRIKEETFSISQLETAINRLVASTVGQESEAAFDKLFDDMNLQNKDLGKEVSDRTELISKVILKISDISFGYEDAEFDVLGTAYMILIGMFADSAGKKGGEFFTPFCCAKLLNRLIVQGINPANVKNAADSCAGSGSLLLELQKALGSEITHFYCQEKNGSTFNLLRMNLLMHNIPYKHFSAYNDDTLLKDNFGDTMMSLQVENPPFSQPFPAENKSLLDDARYSGAGVLPPKSYADLGFVEHMVHHMDTNGRIAVVLPHGVLFRKNAEGVIRRYLVEKLNVIDAVIGLPNNLFHSTSIPALIMILKRNRNGDSNNICFIDASKYYKANRNSNELTDEDIDRIVKAYAERKDIEKFCHIASMDEIIANDYNLNIPRYVDTFEKEAEIDLDDVRSRLADIKSRKQTALGKVNSMLALLGQKGV